MVKFLSLVCLLFVFVSCSTSKEVDPLDENLVLAEGDSSVLDDIDFSDEDDEFGAADLDEGSDDLSFSDFEEKAKPKKEEPLLAEDDFAGFEDSAIEDSATAGVDVPLSIDFDEPAVEEESFDSPIEVESAKNDQNLFRNESASGGSKTLVTSIDYNAYHNGGAFMVSTSNPASYATEYVPETNQYILKLKNAGISKSLARPFLTKDFRQSFEAMNSYKGNDGSVRLVFQLKGKSFPKVSLYEGKLIVEPGIMADTELKANRLGEEDSAGKLSLSATSFEDFLLDKTEFVGRPISIQVRDENVVSVIQFISQEVGANIVMSEGVTGKISIKLKDVPWDQALVTIMKAKSLGYVRSGNILRIAPLEELQKESLAAAEVQKARQTLAPFHVKVFPLSYASPDIIETKIKPFLTTAASGGGERAGQAISEVRSSSLIIRDTYEVIQNISALIKELDRPPLQVLIKSKIIEASKEFSKEIQGMGVSLGPGTRVNGGTSEVRSNLSYVTGGEDSGTWFPEVTIGGIDFLGTLTARLRLQELDTKVKVLSAPSVMAINNEPAEVVQIDNVVNVVRTVEEGITTLTPTFTPVELSLKVTPQVSADSNIIMGIEVMRSVPKAEANNFTSVGTRTAKTKVIVGNNKTAMIGGIYQVTESESEQGAPVLRKLPLLGWLFKNDISSKRDSELIIFVTPRVINQKSIGDNLADQRLDPSGGDSVSKF